MPGVNNARHYFSKLTQWVNAMRWLKSATSEMANLNDGTALFASMRESAEKILIAAAHTEDTKDYKALPEPKIGAIVNRGSYHCIVLEWEKGSVFCFPNYQWASDENMSVVYNTEAKALKNIRSKSNADGVVEVEQLDRLPNDPGESPSSGGEVNENPAHDHCA